MSAVVSTIELFFDLVFVFAATQLTAVLVGDLSWIGVARVVLMLAAILWVFGAYAWLTNAAAPATTLQRGLLVLGMAGLLVIAQAVPTAFTTGGWAFGLGYLITAVVHTGLFALAGGRPVVRVFRTLAPLNLASAGLILAGGFAPGAWRWGLWLTAVVLQRTSPYIDPVDRFVIAPGHFVERHGLIVIIALGESLMVVGGHGAPLTPGLVAAGGLGLGLTSLMWWVYFGGDDARARAALDAARPRERARAAFDAYGWAYLGLLAGVLAVAAGLAAVATHPMGHLDLAQATVLAAGLAVYLLADVAFRLVLRIRPVTHRVVAALVALATIPIGRVSALAQLATLIVVLLILRRW